MTNQEYVSAVERGEYPGHPALPTEVAFADDRGTIKNVLLTPVSSFSELRSKAGTVRANHWHRTDWHYAYVVSGKVLYFERAVGETEIPTPTVFYPGDAFFTPPNREHAMVFPIDTVIVTLARNVRNHENHEADLVRVSFISPETAAALTKANG